MSSRSPDAARDQGSGGSLSIPPFTPAPIYCWADAMDEIDRLRADLERQEGITLARVRERDRARHLAKHLFLMVEPQAWRDSGGDDGQGHYEGDYHAEQIEEEIRSWE